MQKFENVDVIAALDEIMRQNTAFYQSDFDIDKGIIQRAAASDQPADKTLLWMSRPSGTYCFRERDVFLKGTRQHNTWKFYGEQTRDKILAYAVELTGIKDGTIRGNLYELDYQQHYRHVIDAALPVSVNRLFYERGSRDIPAEQYFDGSPDRVLGNFLRYEFQPRDPAVLQGALQQEQRGREQARPGDFKAHTTTLHNSRIETEAQRIVDKLKDLSAPNSPNKTHFMVEISPHFNALASTKDNDRLFAMLPYKSLCFTGIKDRHGVYAMIGKDERRDVSIRRPRLSIRKQLTDSKQAASPKKAAARAKKNELEVLTMQFTVEEENLICMYHNAARRRTMGKITAALPDMDGDMRALAQQTLSKLKRMTDADYDGQKFLLTDE